MIRLNIAESVIFEEYYVDGWKEMDSIVRYPLDCPLHHYFLLVKFPLNDTIRMVQGAGFEPPL